MSDSLEVRVLRNALANEQIKTAKMQDAIVHMQCELIVRNSQLNTTTRDATLILRQLRRAVERLQNDLAARN
jgi:hypothetical protein